MRRYDKYKDSGISWIGEIPEHWEIRKAKYMFIKNKRSVRPEDEVITCFRDGQVTLRKNRRITGFTESISEIGYQGIRKGDLVIHQMDAFAGAIGVSDSDGKGTSVYHCCTPIGEYDTMYYAYILRKMALSGFIQSLYRGIRERSSDFNYFTFGNQYLPIPPLLEQQQIVDFLKDKTAKIDTYIQEKEQEIRSLEELKQAEIAFAVTHGINLDVPMKDSGIAWIGEIPEHWGLIRNKNCLEECKQEVGKSKDYALLSLTKNGVILRDLESNKGKFPKDFESYKVVHPNNIIFCLFDIDETPRTVGLSSIYGMITGAYNVFSIKNIVPKYLYFLYESIDDKKGLKPLYTGLRKIIKTDRFLNAKLPFPPLSEQQQIVDFLEGKTAQIDKYISDVKRQIDSLKEYRQRLIGDTVTGRINVQPKF